MQLHDLHFHCILGGCQNDDHPSQCTDKETGAQRGEVSSPKTHSQWEELGSEPELSASRSRTFAHTHLLSFIWWAFVVWKSTEKTRHVSGWRNEKATILLLLFWIFQIVCSRREGLRAKKNKYFKVLTVLVWKMIRNFCLLFLSAYLVGCFFSSRVTLLG